MEGPDPSEPKKQCQYCSRNFAISSFSRHEEICRKKFAKDKKPKKPFDSGKQRATNSDIPLSSVRKVQQEMRSGTSGLRSSTSANIKRPSTNWREKHEAFMSIIQSAKKVDYALKTGAPLPPPPIKSYVPSDYVQCEYCGRNFNKNAAERHVPFCREQKMRQKPSPVSSASTYARKPAPLPNTTNRPHNQPMIVKRGSLERLSVSLNQSGSSNDTGGWGNTIKKGTAVNGKDGQKRSSSISRIPNSLPNARQNDQKSYLTHKKYR
uniref:Zinc finger C2HC domain-containing protein 1A n=1 Tax=Romanomermis culicivorax TaxID=13658 RepID=A0A915JXN7_ROMCU